MKTKFDSYYLGEIPKGCKYCVRGEKAVIFLGGKCSRNCWYCSLSDSRKKCLQIFINERPLNKISDLFEEIRASKSRGAGVTGGDPLVNFSKNIRILKLLRQKMGKNFHIHIYLPLNLVDERKIRKIKECVDEIRFHPSYLFNDSEKLKDIEISKIKMASKIFGKRNIGLEMPMIPTKKEEVYRFILETNDYISFVNLNEFELSETNFDKVTENYSLNEDSYTIFDSLRAGKEIIKRAIKDNLKIKIHLCSAKTKDFHQYKNRLLKHEILPFGRRLKSGNVLYFAIYDDIPKNLREIKKITKKYFYDEERKRILIEMNDVLKVYENLDSKIARIEEQPVFGNERVSFSIVGE